MEFLKSSDIKAAIKNSLNNIIVDITEENKKSGFIKNNITKAKEKVSDLFVLQQDSDLYYFDQLINNNDLTKNIYNNQKKALYEAQQSVHITLGITNDIVLLNNEEDLTKEILKKYKLSILLDIIPGNILEVVKFFGSESHSNLVSESIKSVTDLQNEIYNSDKKAINNAKEKSENYVLENKDVKDSDIREKVACHFLNIENAKLAIENLEDYNTQFKLLASRVNVAINTLNTSSIIASANADSEKTLNLMKSVQEITQEIIDQDVKDDSNNKLLDKIKEIRQSSVEETKETKDVKKKY